MADHNWGPEFLDIVNFNRIHEETHDAVHQAADDIRLVEAARFALDGTTTTLVTSSETVEGILGQIEYDYNLTPTEVLIAMGISQDRIAEQSHE